MKAVLLAAGRGTRLAPLTDRLPKILVEVCGEPLLGRQLRYLASQGATDVAINLHHLSERVLEYLAASDPPLAVHVFDEPELLGTAGALVPMRSLLTEPFVVLYGDVVTDVDLRRLDSERRGMATLCYYVSSETEGKGVLEVDPAQRVVAFVEKPPAAGAAVPINAGIYALDPGVIPMIPERADFGYDVWPRLLGSGEIYGHRVEGYVADLGSPDALVSVEEDVRNGVVRW